MAGSGAGLNRSGVNGGVAILQTSETSGTVSSGLIVEGGQFFSKWTFQLIPLAPSTTFSGHSVAVYGTIDPQAIILWQQFRQGQIADLSSFPSTSFFQLPAPADGSTGDLSVWNNPLTDVGQCLYTPMPLVGVAAVDTITDGSGGVALLMMSIP
jgi:hypothetical protein